MSRTRSLVLAAIGVAAIAAPAAARAPEPVKDSYALTLPVPNPLSIAGVNGGCQDGEEGVTKDTHEITLPSKGTLVVTLSGFQVDWDLYLYEGSKQIALSEGDQGATTEKITYKKAKAGQKIAIVACNWSGGPTGNVEYTFTPGK